MVVALILFFSCPKCVLLSITLPDQMTIQWGAVVKAIPLAENCVGLAFFQPPAYLQNLGFAPNATLPGTNTPALVLRCPTAKAANELYALIWSRRDLMADPRGMPEPQEVDSAADPSSDEAASDKGWTCPVCTLHNLSPLSLACEACGSAKPHNASGGGSASGGSGGGGEVYVFGSANTPNKMVLSSAEVNLDERKLLEVCIDICFLLLFVAFFLLFALFLISKIVAPLRSLPHLLSLSVSPSHVLPLFSHKVSKKELFDALNASNRKRTSPVTSTTSTVTMTAATKGALDGVAWKFCRIFTGTHKLMSSKRVAVLLLLNESTDPIQVRRSTE